MFILWVRDTYQKRTKSKTYKIDLLRYQSVLFYFLLGEKEYFYKPPSYKASTESITRTVDDIPIFMQNQRHWHAKRRKQSTTTMIQQDNHESYEYTNISSVLSEEYEYNQ